MICNNILFSMGKISLTQLLSSVPEWLLHDQPASYRPLHKHWEGATYIPTLIPGEYRSNIVENNKHLPIYQAIQMIAIAAFQKQYILPLLVGVHCRHSPITKSYKTRIYISLVEKILIKILQYLSLFGGGVWRHSWTLPWLLFHCSLGPTHLPQDRFPQVVVLPLFDSSWFSFILS